MNGPIVDLISSLSQARANYLLNRAGSEVLVEWAVAALLEGTNSPEVAALAGLARDSPREEVLEALRRVEADWDLPPMSLHDARVEAALMEAESLLDARSTPIAVARNIWRLRDGDDLTSRFIAFGGLASEWDDNPDSRAQYDQEIRDAAFDLLRSSRVKQGRRNLDEAADGPRLVDGEVNGHGLGELLS